MYNDRTLKIRCIAHTYTILKFVNCGICWELLGFAFFYPQRKLMHAVQNDENPLGQFSVQIGYLIIRRRETFKKCYWILPSLIFRSPIGLFLLNHNFGGSNKL